MDERAGAVREMISHFWKGYKASGWGCDEVAPIAGGCGRGSWGNLGMTIVDSLDTLWLAGLHAEFLEGEQWVADNFLSDGQFSTGRVSFFETTIRALAGLLSSYALSKRPVLLQKARKIGDRLLNAFRNRPWVASYIDIRRPQDIEATPHWRRSVALADAGSNVLEFAYLSRASGDPKYERIADEHMRKIMRAAKKSHRELAPMFLDPSSERFAGNAVSMAACADSYFEYLLKMYLLSGKTDLDALYAWKAAMLQMRSSLVGVSREGLTYVAVQGYAGGQPGSPVMDHLSCFVGGNLALGSYVVPKEHAEDWWLPLGIQITRSCYETYHRSPTGLAAEVNSFADSIFPQERHFRLRPETLESLFYLYRITGNSTYRDWSWQIIQAINRTARTKYGFAKVLDTGSKSIRFEDSQETFMGAETLKYALLIHLPAEVLPLESFVFNTEAHPFPVKV